MKGSFPWLVGRARVAAAIVLTIGACGQATAPPTASPSAADGTSSRFCQPSGPDCLGPLAPGVHTTANLITPFTFEVPDGWSKQLDVPGSFNLTSDAFPTGIIAVIPDWAIASQRRCTLAPEPGLGRSVHDLATWLSEHPGLITSKPAPVTLGGLEGLEIEIRKDPSWKDTRGKGFLGPDHPCAGRVGLFTHQGTIDDPGYWDIDDSMRMRLLFLDAGGRHIVTVHVETADEASFDGFVDVATPVVESIEFQSASSSEAATPEPSGRLTATASGCHLKLADAPIAPGDVVFTAINRTDGGAAFNIAELADRHAYGQLVAHIDKEIELAKAGKPGLGHPSFAVPLFEVLLEPHGRGRLQGTLEPGIYGLTCGREYQEVGEMRPAGVLAPIEVR